MLVTFPTQPPHNLSAIYRGPIKIVEVVREDIFKCSDLVSGK